MIKCDICGSSLVMDADKKGATCTVCGMKYSIEQVRQMAGITTSSEPHIDVLYQKQDEDPIEVTEWKERSETENTHHEEAPVVVNEWKEKDSGKTVEIHNNGSGTKKKKIHFPVYLYVLGIVGILMISMGGFFPMLIGDIIVIVTIILFVVEKRKEK